MANSKHASAGPWALNRDALPQCVRAYLQCALTARVHYFLYHNKAVRNTWCSASPRWMSREDALLAIMLLDDMAEHTHC